MRAFPDCTQLRIVRHHHSHIELIASRPLNPDAIFRAMVEVMSWRIA